MHFAWQKSILFPSVYWKWNVKNENDNKCSQQFRRCKNVHFYSLFMVIDRYLFYYSPGSGGVAGMPSSIETLSEWAQCALVCVAKLSICIRSNRTHTHTHTTCFILAFNAECVECWCILHFLFNFTVIARAQLFVFSAFLIRNSIVPSQLFPRRKRNHLPNDLFTIFCGQLAKVRNVILRARLSMHFPELHIPYILLASKRSDGRSLANRMHTANIRR